ncbi:MAG: GTPase HflX [Phycisphaerales bacterium JB061]
MNTSHRNEVKIQSERAVLAAVRLPDSRYNQADPFGELKALAEQAGAVVVGTLEQQLVRPVAGSYMGTGKLDELRALCAELDAKTVIFDHELSPKQIANIEKVVERKVLDRSEVILDIFASRATTHEAKLQVEIAQLEYTYPRLRAMWTHLERIVGGSPGGVGTRGPGEQQLEIDRRLVQQRKSHLKRELSVIQARKTRSVEKRNVDSFTVGLVGYTNAGKSTLFNSLTEGGAYADDRLFATLMTRTRKWDLGQGVNVMLSDTVGFVRDLPHNLVASFRATLEEATHADLLLIVLDVSDPSAELQYNEVIRTLDELFDEVEREHKKALSKGAGHANVPDWKRPERLVLLNKVDRLRDNRELLVWQQKIPQSLPISALPSTEDNPSRGQEELTRRVREAVLGEDREVTLTLPLRDSRTLHTLETRAEILDRQYDADTVTLRVRVGSRLLTQLRSGGSQLKLDPDDASKPAAWAPSPDADTNKPRNF